MLRFACLLAMSAGVVVQAQDAKPFTLRQILSAPYALDLTAAPVGARFAWVENAEGSRNVWVGGPKEAARMVTHYSEDDAQDINGLVWSPSGDAVAYAYGAPNGANGKPANPAHLQRGTAVEVWVQPVSGDAKAVDLGEGRAPLFTRDGKSVLFVRAGEIWIADVKRGAESVKKPVAERLVIDRGSDGGLVFSPDGEMLAFVSRRSGHSFIGLFDMRAKTLTFLSPGTGRDFAPSFSADGKRVAWLRGPWTEAAEFAADRMSKYPWSVMVADVAAPDVARAVYTADAGKPGSVLPHLATGEPKIFWMADGRLVFFSEMDGWVHLYAVDATRNAVETRVRESGPGAPVLLTPGRGEVEDVVQGPSGVLMWASNVPACAKGVCDLKDEDRRHLWKLEAGKAVAVTSGDASEVKPQMAADGTVAALMSDGSSPMHPVLVSADGATATLRPGELAKDFPLDAAKALRPQQVLIPEGGVAPKGVAKDDVRVSLHGQLFLPPDESRNADPPTSSKDDNQKGLKDDKQKLHPALIFTHGGPMREMLLGYPAMEYYSNAYAMNQYLASRGFVVLSVNYHCGIGYGTDFRQCVHAGADGASEYADVLAAAKWLRARKDVDAKRIGLWGGSYGGYLTALGLARNSDLFVAGVDFHGVHDWILEDNNADWLKGNNAERDVIAAKAKASSPIADVAKWKSPVLLIHGDNDGNVAFNQTPMLADALRARGVHVEELIFPDEIHEFLLHKDWLKAYEAEAAFFERVLKP
jgi:dipeptidyl aminopeptidase/acylaminoacyl peptidase